jgi:hypothetical protein
MVCSFIRHVAIVCEITEITYNFGLVLFSDAYRLSQGKSHGIAI